MTDQNVFVYSLLARCAEIQRAISVITPDNNTLTVKFAYPRWWQPIGNDAFPGFFNRAVRISSTPNGRPIRKDLYRVTMRLIIGPAFAGYQGEYEDFGNMLYLATINAFGAQQRLAVPPLSLSSEPLQYVESAVITTGDNGIEGKSYNDKDVYLCLDVPLDVTCNMQVYRQS